MPRSRFWETSGRCTKFAGVTKVLVFPFTAPFSGCLQSRIKNLVENLQWSFFAKMLNRKILFAKKLHRRCSNRLKISYWLRVSNIELTHVPNLLIKPKKYPARKCVCQRFWNGERSWWNSTKVYAEAADRRVL